MKPLFVVVFVALMLMLMLHNSNFSNGNDFSEGRAIHTLKNKLIARHSKPLILSTSDSMPMPTQVKMQAQESARVATVVPPSNVMLISSSPQGSTNSDLGSSAVVVDLNNNNNNKNDNNNNNEKNKMNNLKNRDDMKSKQSDTSTLEKKSRYAYVTLLHGLDSTLKYKGFLLNTLIIRASLDRLGSKHDLIAMIGFTDLNTDIGSFENDMNILKSHNVKILLLPRMTTSKSKISFAEMALLKITPWSLTEYERLQFFDGDILPTRNLDCFFQLNENTFNTGSASPLNSGWYLAVPNRAMYDDLWSLSLVRLGRRWNETTGWGAPIPKQSLFYRNSRKAVESWNFNGASLDQGLLTYYLVMTHGGVTLLDVNEGRRFQSSFRSSPVALQDALRCCGGSKPVDFFAHFTGRNKPWLQDLAKTRDKSLILWRELLDKLNLPINSTNIGQMGQNFKSPLGYFHPNI